MKSLSLILGNRNYSSWSLRAWLVARQAAGKVDEVTIRLAEPESRDRKLGSSPSGRIPVLRHGDLLVWESLAICEYLNERFPEAGLWPEEIEARAIARSVSSEMHGSFTALRRFMPMNVRARKPGKGRAPGVAEDIERVQAVWNDCRTRFGTGGDYLFGDFGIADAMFAPVVFRFRTYDVHLDTVCGAYVETMLARPDMKEWEAAAIDEPWTIAAFEI